MRLVSLFTFLTFHAFGAEVVFLEGSPSPYPDRDPEFFHVALYIESSKTYINARPYWGVIEQASLDSYGKITRRIPIWGLSDEEVARRARAFLGLRFDHTYTWREGDDDLYCSELVAKVLEIPPKPMTYGQGLGLSPNEVYEALKQRSPCVNLLLALGPP